MPHDLNTLLFLFRFDLSDPNRGQGEIVGLQGLERLPTRMDESKRYCLVAGVLDPSMRATNAPLTDIVFDPDEPKNHQTYNGIQDRVAKLHRLYYRHNGLIANPTHFTEEVKKDVLDEISSIGLEIYHLLKGSEENPLRKWLDKFLAPKGKGAVSQKGTHVTIVTNDFTIPWFWLKGGPHQPYFCQTCSLGMLRIETYGRKEKPPPENTKVSRALLVGGSRDLPFADDDLKFIANKLGESLPLTGNKNRFDVERADSRGGVLDIPGKFDEREFKIVHYAGHYTSEKLLINGEEIKPKVLEDLVHGALLVLDGCSSSHGLKAWTDYGNVTAHLIDLGALGCVATVLPVKHDPLVNEILWGEFYAQVRSGRATIGQALVNARVALHGHFKDVKSHDPTWLFYQLIGNPSMSLFEE